MRVCSGLGVGGVGLLLGVSSDRGLQVLGFSGSV